ncbi:DUF4215 domain-containing protein [Corallococcus exercitus]|uniref:DUF4215 domain-containing protein n=2 Tax=Corallococcus exercitus TaxID=2316736 RepID=A0A7Y4JNQ3_9BACT|nr:DUF4215 domain-containing protein [Corallococcus exercitus]
MFTTLMNSLRGDSPRMALRAGLHALALCSLFLLAGCESATSTSEPVLTSQSSGLVGDGRLQPGEQCDDGNTASGDGCSATGTVEAGFLCNVPGNACSLASLCGNNVTDSGELCDDGDTADNGNGCSATCDLSLCGNGTFDNRQYPSYAQEVCDDGNRFEGDGCSRQCEVEPGFACAGSPSRCVRAGVAVFNTGVDSQNRRLPAGGVDPHWFYSGTTTGADTGVRNANDWPLEMQTARFMAPQGAQTCVYQDFLIPSTTNVAQFRLRLATFNDNQFDSAKVNGVDITPVTVSEPPGQPWQKNIFREFGTNAAWHAGVNRIELCNENAASPPNAFRYLFVDAYDDRCGDGAISPREECDDGNAKSGDGCSATCGIEPGYGCTGAPSTCAQTCGNGNLNPGEQCDDGNTTANDGCNASCRVEDGYACPTPGQACAATCGNGAINAGEQCDDGNAFSSDGCSAACRIETGYTCSGAPSVCAPLCGNGVLNAGELCDDGNTALGDGCSNACTLELGYACATPGQPCAKTCGDGTVNPGEQCDDGNLTSGDGCATECRVEDGYACSMPSTGPSVCAQTCGNGALDANETCDDGDKVSGDGCSNGCQVEAGYSCSGAPSTCVTLCGDGIRAGAEACDDGNTTVGDGCNATCTVEPGYSCPAPGTSCFKTCGDGVLNAGEQCDDGNAANGDGCNTTCAVEPGYSCNGSPSACGTTCGDGVRAGTEVCDDGNLVGGDTCSPRCLLEVGQTCNASNVCEGFCDPSTQKCVAQDPGPVTPAPVITGPVANTTVSTGTPPISGTSEPGATVTVREGTTVVCTATTDASGHWTCTPTTPLADGPHTVTATAQAPGSATSFPSTAVPFVVNTQVPAPAAPVITGPVANSTVTTGTPAISGTGEPGATVTVREGSTVVCTATVDGSGHWSCVPTTPLPDGPHTVTATAQTPGGTSPASTPVPFVVDTRGPDTQAPDTSIVKGPAPTTSSRTADFEYASTEEGSTFECRLDGGEWGSCQDSYTVGTGDHVLQVRAVDGSGNRDESPAEYTWTVQGSRAFAGGGCSTAPDASWLALLGLMGVPGLRRRQRRTA